MPPSVSVGGGARLVSVSVEGRAPVPPSFSVGGGAGTSAACMLILWGWGRNEGKWHFIIKKGKAKKKHFMC